MATKKLKVLNLYAGIGGNRKLWPDDEIEVTAVENNPEIAAIYQDFFPNDKVVVDDAHQYLLDHYKEFDFIWSSPPCQSHSCLRRHCSAVRDDNFIYPDMNLYSEIIFLTHHYKGKWCVENTKSYYKPLIPPIECGSHFFWSNFIITNRTNSIRASSVNTKEQKEKITGFSLDGYKIKHRKDQILNNCVEPETGLHIFRLAFKEPQTTL